LINFERSPEEIGIFRLFFIGREKFGSF